VTDREQNAEARAEKAEADTAKAEAVSAQAEANTADIVITLQEYEEERNKRIMQAVMGLVAMILLVSFNLWYTSYSQAKADSRWCELVGGLDDRYQRLSAQQKADPEVAKFIRTMGRLRSELHC
jgi:hypothetical protein